MEQFKSLVFQETSEGNIKAIIEKKTMDDLHQGDVTIEVAYSGVNYKDALASKASSGVIRHYPLIGGIDLSGTILTSEVPEFKKGDKVMAMGYTLGVAHHGGYSQIARIPAEWLIKVPETLSLKEAMIFGTAGLTAAQSVHALLTHGLSDNMDARILVTGPTGGVGSLAIGILKKLGYKNIIALSRKKETASDYLMMIGASEVIDLQAVTPEKQRPLGQRSFDYILDTVGGEQLATLLPQVNFRGSVTMCGNAAGIHFQTTVLPFILRGINLFGIDSLSLPTKEKNHLWQLLATEWYPDHLEQFVQETLSLDELPTAFKKLLDGQMTGRYLVEI